MLPRQLVPVAELFSRAILSPWRNRHLVTQLAARDIIARHKGSLLGKLWTVIHPLLLLTVYTIVFTRIFQVSWGGQGGDTSSFALVLFLGLIVFNLLAECLSGAPNLLAGNRNFVQKIVFPLEVLPWAKLLAALYHAAMSLAIWVAAYFLVLGPPPATVVLLPLIVLPVLLIAVGSMWLFAASSLFFPDIRQLVQVLTTVLLFLSPIFYPVESVPESLHALYHWNPIAQTIESSRAVALWGELPAAGDYARGLCSSTIYFIGCAAFFERTRPGFADVI